MKDTTLRTKRNSTIKLMPGEKVPCVSFAAVYAASENLAELAEAIPPSSRLKRARRLLASRASSAELSALIAGTPGTSWQDLVALAEIAQKRDGSPAGKAATAALIDAIASLGVKSEATIAAEDAQVQSLIEAAA